MISLLLVLMMQGATTQFLVSTRAGLVNYVQGSANVKAAISVPAGEIISTGPGGAVELLLNPGSYLRMGENTRVVLDRVELYDIAVRILAGSMVIETNGFSKDLPLKVTTGDLKMEIIKDGVYLFADGKVIVASGRIRDAGNGLVYSKGYEISNDQGYRTRRVKTFTTGLELWSQKRDEEISRANFSIAKSLRQTQNLPVSSFLDVWLWYPAFGCFVYMPGGRYRSPYGYSYLSAGQVYSGGSSTASGGSSGGFGSGNNGGSSNGASSGGGGFGGGFGGGVPSTGASSSTPSAGAQAGHPGGRQSPAAP